MKKNPILGILLAGAKGFALFFVPFRRSRVVLVPQAGIKSGTGSRQELNCMEELET